MLWASALGQMILKEKTHSAMVGMKLETCRPRSCGLSKRDPFLTLWGSHTSAADGLGVLSTSLETFTALQKMHLSLDHLTYQATPAEVDLKLSRGMGSPRDVPSWVSQQRGDEKVEGELMQLNYTL